MSESSGSRPADRKPGCLEIEGVLFRTVSRRFFPLPGEAEEKVQ